MLIVSLTFYLSKTRILSQSWLINSKMNFYSSNFFQSRVQILHFDGGALLKNSGKIRNWGRWSDTVDVRLPDIDFVEWLRLQNMLSIRVEEEEIW